MLRKLRSRLTYANVMATLGAVRRAAAAPPTRSTPSAAPTSSTARSSPSTSATARSARADVKDNSLNTFDVSTLPRRRRRRRDAHRRRHRQRDAHGLRRRRRLAESGRHRHRNRAAGSEHRHHPRDKLRLLHNQRSRRLPVRPTPAHPEVRRTSGARLLGAQQFVPRSGDHHRLQLRRRPHRRWPYQLRAHESRRLGRASSADSPSSAPSPSPRSRGAVGVAR